MTFEDKSKEQIIAELLDLRKSYEQLQIKFNNCQQTKDDLINFIDPSPDAFVLVGLDGKIKRINPIFCKTILGCNAEENLKKANDHLNTILESISDAFFTLDNEWRFTYFNKKAESTYKRKQQEVIGKNIWEEFPQYIGTEYQKDFFKAMKDRLVVHTEGKGIYSNEWVSIHIYPSKDGISVYYRDISERKRMEIALQESEERYRKLFELSPDSIFVHYKGVIIATNVAGAKLLGFKEPEEVYGKNLLEFIHPDYQEGSKTRYYLAMEGISLPFLEKRMICSDGTIIDVETTAVSLTYQGKKCIQVVIRDITNRKAERKRAEELLLNQFRQLSTIFDSIDALVYAVDIETYELFFINKYGVDRLGAEVVGKPCFQVLQSDQAEPCAFCTNNLLLRNGLSQEPYIWEFKNTVSNRWFQCIDRAITWVDGRLVRVEIAFDITERKNMEEELKRVNQQVTDILESITNSFFALDNEWKITYINREALRYFKKTKEQLLDQIFWNVFPKTRNTIIYSNFNKAMSERVATYFEVYGMYGERWLEVNAYPYQGGISVYFRDITDRKLLQDNLRLSEARFSKAFNYSPISMSIYSIDSDKYFAINESCIKMYGYGREEIIGRSEQDLKVWVDLDVREKYTKDIEKKGFAHNHEFRARKKSGEIFLVLLSGVAITLNDEKCILSTTLDVTEIRTYQKEISRLDRLNLIGEMAAGIAHEIRNPMTTVRGFLQMLGSKKEYLKYKEYHDVMISELDRANSIISEFLSLAKNKPDNLQLQNLNLIVEAIYPLIKADAANLNKDVKIEIGAVSELLLNEKEIRQLLLNLVRNGLEAMSPGECITIKTYTEQDEVILLVQDKGKGIEPALLEKLGTPFLTTKPDGTGLGLAISYSIAKRNNAKIEVNSGPKGTTFYVKFKVP
ncbi:hypothetical protein JCM14036_17320 [Desulfotomaculum defluvii]